LDGAHVDVGVGEARHERPALEVERLDLALEGPDLAGADDVLDALAFDYDRGAVHGLLAGAVDQECVRQDRDGHVRLLASWRCWLRTSTPSRRRAAASRPSWRRRRDRAAARGTPTAPRSPPSAGFPPRPRAASLCPRW